MMAQRKRADRPQYIPLTEAQRLFAFRTLKQLIYYLERRESEVRQKRRGRRHYVCVADLAAELLLDDPRSHLEGIGRADAPRGRVDEVDAIRRVSESVLKENAVLRQEQDKLRSELREAVRAWLEGSGRREVLAKEKLVLVEEVEHLKGFLKDHGLFKAWQESWKYRYSRT